MKPAAGADASWVAPHSEGVVAAAAVADGGDPTTGGLWVVVPVAGVLLLPGSSEPAVVVAWEIPLQPLVLNDY